MVAKGLLSVRVKVSVRVRVTVAMSVLGIQIAGVCRTVKIVAAGAPASVTDVRLLAQAPVVSVSRAVTVWVIVVVSALLSITLLAARVAVRPKRARGLKRTMLIMTDYNE
jgi:hypothetical protein